MTARRDSRFDDCLAETLKDPAEAAVYIEATLELEDMDALLVALRHVARAHGMADVARRAELGEQVCQLREVHPHRLGRLARRQPPVVDRPMQHRDERRREALRGCGP